MRIKMNLALATLGDRSNHPYQLVFLNTHKLKTF